MNNRAELEALVEGILASETTQHWEALFLQADVPASAILSVPEALEHPHTAARGMFPELRHRVYGGIRVPGPPLRLGGAQVEAPLPPPVLGQDTEQVLRDILGCDDAAIASLRRDGAIPPRTEAEAS